MRKISRFPFELMVIRDWSFLVMNLRVRLAGMSSRWDARGICEMLLSAASPVSEVETTRLTFVTATSSAT